MQGPSSYFPSPPISLTRPDVFRGGGERPPIFPQEISEMIIDELGRSYQFSALQSCSLTCRAWLPRSRHHIHAAVRIDLTSKLDRLAELYSAELAAYVRSLSIDACDIEGDGLPSPTHEWIDSKPAHALLVKLTNIERLSLDAIYWDKLQPATKEIILTHYPLVKDVWISTCDFFVDEFYDLLQAFPQVESIRMEGVIWEKLDVAPQVPRQDLTLKWLDVGDLCNKPGVVAKWARSFEHISIENVHFTWDREDPTDLSELLKRAGDSIKTLSLCLNEHFEGWTPMEDLRHNRGLRLLHLLLRFDSSDIRDLSWVTETIMRVESALLTEVAIYAEAPSNVQLENLDWAQIDVTLANIDRLPSLRKVDLCILRRYGCGTSLADNLDPEAEESFRQKMPKLMNRGILHVSQQQT